LTSFVYLILVGILSALYLPWIKRQANTGVVPAARLRVVF